MLKKAELRGIALEWFNFDEPMESDANKVEFYLQDVEDRTSQAVYLKELFFDIFSERTHSIYVVQERISADWGGLPLDTWVLRDDEFVFDASGELSNISQKYLSYLEESNIEHSYHGACTCDDWHRFLDIIISGVLDHTFVYSPKVLDMERNILLYFHHTGSIGVYFKDKALLSYFAELANKHTLNYREVM